MWRHNRLDAQLQVRDCSVLEPKAEYIGITSKGLCPNLSRASLREPQSLTTRSCDWNVGVISMRLARRMAAKSTLILSEAWVCEPASSP